MEGYVPTITYNDINRDAPTVIYPTDGLVQIRFFDGKPEDANALSEEQIDRIRGNPWFSVVDDTPVEAVPTDEKADLLAQIAAKGGKAKGSMSVETLKNILEGLV
jgi:hypothetical protein